MRNPVTLLCLADLHCEKEEFKYFSWLADSLWYYTKQLDNTQWEPNYLVIAGDIVFAKREKETEEIQKDKYYQAERVIEEFTTRFPHLKDGHIVIVPGNHDKTIPEDEDLSNIVEERDTFFDYIKKIDDSQNKKNVIKKFSEVFERRFKLYLNFVQQYQQNAKYNNETIIGSNIRDLAGVRVFQDDNLCFVPINTEWLYIPGKKVIEHIRKCVDKNNNLLNIKVIKHIKKSVDKNSNLLNILDNSVSVLERCSLCSPLIKDAYDKLVNDYKRENYTVITVMHRGPEYLPYEDKNPTDKAKPDSLGKILHLSDILLTGHEHQTRTDAPPSYIGNSVLHFKLGSVGRKEKNASENIRWASLIHIDPISGSVEHLPFVFNCTQQKWEPKPSNSYSLRSNYDICTPNKDSWEFNGSIPVLYIKSNIKDIIEERIRKYFEVNKDAFVIDADQWDNPTEKQGLTKAIEVLASNNQHIRVVVYYRASQDAYGDLKVSDDHKKTMKKIDQLRTENVKFILLNKLIINEVIIKSE